MDVYYTYKPCTSAERNPSGWRNLRIVNDDGTCTDQFMPSIDFFSNGTIVIPFYDRREDDPTNTTYHQFYGYLDQNGTRIQANQKIDTTCAPYDPCPASDPAYHQQNEGPDPSFVGDYQDVWVTTLNDGEKAISSFSLTLSDELNGEIYVSPITP